MAATRFVGQRKKKEKEVICKEWVCVAVWGWGKGWCSSHGFKKVPNHFRTRPLKVQTMEQFLDLKRHLNTFCFSLLQTMSL